MKTLIHIFYSLSLFASVHGMNQTSTISPIYSSAGLPFEIEIKQAGFQLPAGLQGPAWGAYKGKWLLIAGRTNGMHGFNNDPNNFPPNQQNTTVYVIDPVHKTIDSRSLTDSASGLTQAQIDNLSVTALQFIQTGKKLYLVGGYGVVTATGQFNTKDTLTSIDLPGLMHWVVNPSENETAAQHIKQISDPYFRVTGGDMFQFGNNPVLLVFGQDFQGYYFDPTLNGLYTKQVLRFEIIDDGDYLSFKKYDSLPEIPDPNFRRRDLNTVPVIFERNGKLWPGLVALSGVFTPTDGAWTVPVEISADGVPVMANASNPHTFKQGMNNYDSPSVEMFSKETGDMYMVLLGGITYAYFEGGYLWTDDELPFTNQCTTIKVDKYGQYSQYIMNGTYPYIASIQSNPGNQLLFGAEAIFIPAEEVQAYPNGVLKLSCSKKPKMVGYVVGGIQSTVPNTSTMFDSAASPYIFEVFVVPHL